MSEDWARPMVHWDIQARDQGKIRDFYSTMFNWQISDGPIMVIPAGIGGVEPDAMSGHIFPSDTAGFRLYVQVRDLRESMEKAKDLGGAVVSEPFDVPGGPTIAGITDPEGNRLVLIQQ
jgi:predicted enzyme related to lactoylglutathione lyase